MVNCVRKPLQTKCLKCFNTMAPCTLTLLLCFVSLLLLPRLLHLRHRWVFVLLHPSPFLTSLACHKIHHHSIYKTVIIICLVSFKICTSLEWTSSPSTVTSNWPVTVLAAIPTYSMNIVIFLLCMTCVTIYSTKLGPINQQFLPSPSWFAVQSNQSFPPNLIKFSKTINLLSPSYVLNSIIMWVI